MDCMFEAYLTHETVNYEPDDIPQTKDPVWLLGKKHNALEEINVIRRDVLSKLWLTYRKSFTPIGDDCGPTSDKGWGCMLRCGQMLLAQALVHLHLGRDWYWMPESRDSTYLEIVKRFEDYRYRPYSIHQIALMGRTEGKEVGQWFGPNTVAQVLKKLVKYDEWSNIEMHVALDNTLVINDVKKLCVKDDDVNLKTWTPLLLVIPLRLGLSDINPIYFDGLKKCLRFRQSVGFIGGKPNVAFYFIGYVGNDVIYLDPHTTQTIGMINQKQTDAEYDLDATYHCKYANHMPISAMDPSIAVGFLCRTEEDFDDFCTQAKTELIEAESQPLFEICTEKSWNDDELCQTSFKDFVEIKTDGSDSEFEILG